MNKINLKGISAETVTGVLILLIALINADADDKMKRRKFFAYENIGLN